MNFSHLSLCLFPSLFIVGLPFLLLLSSKNGLDLFFLLKQAQGSEIIIFGSPSACHSLMKLNLIDEYWLFVNPVLLGGGTPLFKNIGSRTSLKLSKSKQFTSGVVMLHYEKSHE